MKNHNSYQQTFENNGENSIDQNDLRLMAAVAAAADYQKQTEQNHDRSEDSEHAQNGFVNSQMMGAGKVKLDSFRLQEGQNDNSFRDENSKFSSTENSKKNLMIPSNNL